MVLLESLLVQEAELSSQMQELKDTLSGVHVQIAELQDVNRNAPTYNLPNETLSAIFEAGLSETQHFSARFRRLFRIERKAPPASFEILVSAVSRRWRNVALQTPQLWTELDINVAKSMHHLYDLYLYRSKMCLLDITLTQCNILKKSDVDTDINFKQHLERLIPHVARWKKFVIKHAYIHSPSTALSALTHLYAPALETLEVDFGSSQRPFMEVFSAGAPRLSYLTLIGVYFRPPAESIKSLKLWRHGEKQFSHAEFKQFLQPMSSLTHLSIDSSVLPGTTHSPIELPSVTSLNIVLGIVSVDSFSDGTLRFLDLPAVETLTVQGSTYNLLSVFNQYHRAYPVVRSLAIIYSYYREQDTPAATTLNFITLFPNIQDVVFQGADPSPLLHTLYNRRSTDERLWPHLSAMTITPAERVKVSVKKQIWADVVKFVGNRVQLGIPISSIKLSSEIVERGSQRQQQKLREQVTLVEC